MQQFCAESQHVERVRHVRAAYTLDHRLQRLGLGRGRVRAGPHGNAELLHVGGGDLHGVQDIDPRLDPLGDVVVDRPA